MTVAKLGIKVDVSNLTEATAALNELVAATDRAEAALSKLGFTLALRDAFLEYPAWAVGEADLITKQRVAYRIPADGNGPGSGGNEQS